MKKWLKIVLKILASLLLIIIIALFVSISFIDKTPYFETDYYKNTVDKLSLWKLTSKWWLSLVQTC